MKAEARRWRRVLTVDLHPLPSTSLYLADTALFNILGFLPSKGHRLSHRFQYHVILPSKADCVKKYFF